MGNPLSAPSPRYAVGFPLQSGLFHQAQSGLKTLQMLGC